MGTPEASHIFGYIEMAVKPGRVLTSFRYSAPVARSRKKSTRAMPESSSDRNASTLSCRTRWPRVLGGRSAGIRHDAPSGSTYLAS